MSLGLDNGHPQHLDSPQPQLLLLQPCHQPEWSGSQVLCTAPALGPSQAPCTSSTWPGVLLGAALNCEWTMRICRIWAMRSSSSSLWQGMSVSTIFRNGKTKEKAGADRGAASVRKDKRQASESTMGRAGPGHCCLGFPPQENGGRPQEGPLSTADRPSCFRHDSARILGSPLITESGTGPELFVAPKQPKKSHKEVPGISKPVSEVAAMPRIID